ncbi:GH25 family lysozyme [Thermomonospora cellulosilytica]|uniref:GH25 family lysozyme M1 (1,4-beta-N-acetylmuramidase) n=1 Tax=Thermomonospora cellulosilytica TaxID=1411118 RepID=A0A7W3MV18_9ACTN|nr:GH25 family lysozyme [Thermomonospora cellulosilytica]MBA9002391.1 GH25 family lysozyme M1 (1,4-beta-N-acetylmuramidase) [Thermomonospora cellulosilytica]
MLFGVDVASYQGRPDWPRVRAAGIGFAFSKVTEGVDYKNPTWGHNKAGMLALDGEFLPGAYHFLRSDSDPVAQARHFHRAAGDMDRFAVALDVEPSGDSRPTAAQARAWVAEYKRLSGGHPVIGYFPRWYWAQVGRPNLGFFDSIWQSQYVDGAGSPAGLYDKVSASWWNPFGGEPVSILQYSSSATVPGIPGRCDINAYRGTASQLKALALESAPAPEPKPAVKAPKWPGRYLTQPPVMRGDDVRQWQARMRERGRQIKADGVYGPRSEEVCRAFQEERGLEVDGVVGPETWRLTWEAPIA